MHKFTFVFAFSAISFAAYSQSATTTQVDPVSSTTTPSTTITNAMKQQQEGTLEIQNKENASTGSNSLDATNTESRIRLSTGSVAKASQGDAATETKKQEPVVAPKNQTRPK